MIAVTLAYLAVVVACLGALGIALRPRPVPTPPPPTSAPAAALPPGADAEVRAILAAAAQLAARLTTAA
jgi:Na+-transporting methylmalonyl-CoA/oxaloacetate decarboxylase gamma subunit